MLKAISSHVFLRQRLHPGLLDALARSGAEAIEIYAARQHFDYTSRPHVHELAEWFRSNPVLPFSMHAPLHSNEDMGRDGSPGVNVVHPEKSRRIDAMDEIKRAIEVAEQIPLKYMVIHFGERHDTWSPRTLEHSMTALEHLRAFASPLGGEAECREHSQRGHRTCSFAGNSDDWALQRYRGLFRCRPRQYHQQRGGDVG